MLHTQIFSLKFLFTFLSLSSFTLAQGCGSTNPLVGSKFALQQTTNLRLSGTITVLNDCIIQLSDFSFADPNRELHLTNGDFPITIFNGDVISQTLFSSQLFELLNGISLTTIKRLAVLSDNVILGFVNLRPSLVQSPAVSPIPQITTTTASPQVTQIATSTRTAVAAQATPVRLLAPKLLFVTVSPDALVPIGVSYNLNGLKQPNLTLVRGTTYTFGVIAGTPHPFYLTSSPVGAKGANPNTTETVFAGSSKTFGTAEAPGYVTFTPETSTPNSLFYQCWFHGRMGGVVTVVDQKADGKYEVDVTGTNSTLPPVANVLGSGSNKVGAFWVLIIIGVLFSSF